MIFTPLSSIPRQVRMAMVMTLVAATSCLIIPGCSEDGNRGPGCGSPPSVDVDYRVAMRTFVGDISAHARSAVPEFLVIPQNGLPLLTSDGQPGSPLVEDYQAAISGVGQDGLYYAQDIPTSPAHRTSLTGYLDLMTTAGKPVLATSFCQDHDHVDDAYTRSAARSYLAFATSLHDLSVIPDYPESPHRVHAGDVNGLADACNYLLLADPGILTDREEYLARLTSTDHDILMIHASHGDTLLTPAEVDRLRTKQNGGHRLVLACLPVNVAEIDSDTWQEEWIDDPPSWLEDPLDDTPGSFAVRYWSPEWQAIIFGTPNAALDKIVAVGFDGVYLMGMEAYEDFEDSGG